jgi:pimeloyl-ACP methyl ester carboxylesterase
MSSEHPIETQPALVSEEQTASLPNGIEICYQTIGHPAARPLLLVMGLGGPMTWWPIDLCRQLAAEDFFVIRYDNRDTGRSTRLREHRVTRTHLVAAFLGRRVPVPYSLRDLATDAFGLLDHLGIKATHVAGVSMGGMIAQSMAIEHPERVLSLTSIMSTTGERSVGRPKLRMMGLLMRRAPREKEAFVEHFVAVFKAIGSRGFAMDEERVRRLAAEAYERDHDPAGTGRQLAAILASGDRTERLRALRVPTTVIHGRKDPLVPFRGGKATADAIPDAKLIAIPGMGHDMPREVWPQLVDAISDNAARASASVSDSSEPAVSS